jgi:hypothetical protein
MLWTDIYPPAELTGYARAALADYEVQRGTLARWLPNRDVGDIVARFVRGSTGLVDIAKFRAFDAAPEIGKRQAGERVTLDLPAIGQDIPVTEYDQIRARGGSVSDERLRELIEATTVQVVRAVADAIEYMRGVVLMTGKATIAQDNFKSDDNFGRSASHQVVADDLWATGSVSRLEYLQELIDVYIASNGEAPGAIVAPVRVRRALAQGDEFATQLGNGASRVPTDQQVSETLVGFGLPPIYPYDRHVSVNGVTTKVLGDTTLHLLPAPVETDDWEGTDLGATFWGRTLTSTDADWAIEDDEQPGIVAGVWKHPKPPMGAEVISDAIGLPVLANADRSLAARVLAAS